MTKSSSSLESEIAELAANDSRSKLPPLRQEQIKQNILNQIHITPQNSNSIFQSFKNYFTTSANKFTKFSFIALATILLGGFTTIGIAHASHPGDLLYGLKLKTEKIQLALALTDESKAELQEEFIEAKFKQRNELKTNTENKDDKQDKEISLDISSNKPENRRLKDRNLDDAIQKLEKIEVKLENKGNTNAADRVRKNIERFKSRAAQLEIQQNPKTVEKIDDNKDEKSEKNKKQNSNPNVLNNIGTQSSNKIKVETPKQNTIKVEVDAKNSISTDKLIKN